MTSRTLSSPAAIAVTLAFTLLLPPADARAFPVDLDVPAADTLPVIRMGETVRGTLTAGGPELRGGGGFFQAYRFDASEGTRIVADARSSDFDAYLILAEMTGGITETIREDDDGGEGLDARIRFTVDRSGTYVLIVRSWSDEAAGSFTLSLAERAPPPPAVALPITLGERVTGSLSLDGSTFVGPWDNEIPFDLWTLEARAGEHIRIRMESEDFDAYLEFGTMRDDEFIVDAFDDDGGGDLNALLHVTIPRDGAFTIRARSFGEHLDGDGRYTLLAEHYVPVPPRRDAVSPGAVIEAELTSDDALLDEGSHFREWTVSGRAGERLTIRMRSDDFDPYLLFGREPAAGGFEELARNDDAPDDGLNSLIEFTLPADGEYLIRTRSFGAGSTGAFTLEVRSDGQ